jgi:iron complex outermembrane receptor protein
MLGFAASAADFDFDIPAGDLDTALKAYSKQTGEQLVYRMEDLKGKVTKGAKGTMSEKDALEAILAGTGLSVKVDASGAVAVFPAEAVAGGASTGNAGAGGELEEVVVRATAISQIALETRSATRLDTDPMLIPLSVSTVEEELLRQQQATSLGDVLDNVSGITTEDGYVYARGFEVKSARNGTSDTTAYTNGGQTFRPTVATDRVEVVKGPEQVLQGRGGGIGGILNVVTKIPTPDDYVFLGGAVGSDSYWRLDLDVNGTLVEGRYGVLMGEAIGSTSSQGDGPQDTVGPSQDFYSAGLRWTNADFGSDLSVVYENSTDGVGVIPDPIGGNPLANDAPRFVFGDNRSFSDSERELVEVHYQQRIVGTWYADVTYVSLESSAEFSFFDYYADFVDPNLILASQYRSIPGGKYTTDTFRGSIKGEFATGPVTHKVLLGYDDQTVKVRPGGGTELLGTYFTDVVSRAKTFEPCEFDCSFFSTGTSEDYQEGILFIDQFSWQKWHALLGVRWLSAGYSSSDSFFEFSDSESSTLPQYGLVYAANPQLSFYVSGSEGYRGVAGIKDENGKPLPDTGYMQYEGGVKWLAMGQQLAVTAAIYQIEQTNVPGLGGFTPEFEPYFISIPGITSKGFDLELSGQPLPGLEVRATYAYLEVEDDTTGEPPFGGYLPNRFTLWSQYWFGRERGNGWWAGAGLSAVDAPTLGPDQAEVSGNAIIDLSAGYQGRQWQAILGVKNVGDIDGYQSRGGVKVIGSDIYYTGTPLTSREVRLDVNYQF